MIDLKHNVPKNVKEDLRAAIEHRATWFYYMYKEAKAAGLSDEFAHKAITSCGCFHGLNKFPRTDDLQEFSEAFLSENVAAIFDATVKTDTQEAMEVEFHYCPLVNAWKKLTNDSEMISTMCDIAMDGDRGIVSQYDNFEFKLGTTIADGAPVCQVNVYKK